MATNPLYDTYRQRLQQQGNAQKQEASDAVNRRFAAMGNLNSGAALKQNQLAQQQVQGQVDTQADQLNMAEAQQQFQEGEAQKQRDYGTSERLGSEKFQQGMFDTNLEFQKGVQDFNQWLGGEELKESQRSNEINKVTSLATAFDTDDVGDVAGYLNYYFGDSSGYYKKPALSQYTAGAGAKKYTLGG
jgi:hypothetical protein